MTAEDVINVRVAFLTGNEAPPTGLSPHPDTLGSFPYRVEPIPAGLVPAGTLLSALGPTSAPDPVTGVCKRRDRDQDERDDARADDVPEFCSGWRIAGQPGADPAQRVKQGGQEEHCEVPCGYERAPELNPAVPARYVPVPPAGNSEFALLSRGQPPVRPRHSQPADAG